MDKICGDEEVFKRLYEKKYFTDSWELWPKVTSKALALSEYHILFNFIKRDMGNKYSDKNMFPDCLPYDHNRIKIKKTRNNPEGYVDASLLTVPEIQRKYILANEPPISEYSSFWQLIFEQKVPAIIKLSPCPDTDYVKHQTFYPEKEKPLNIGKFTIICQTHEIFKYYEVRKLIVMLKQETHQLRHYTLSEWYDEQVIPVQTLTDFFKVLRKDNIFDVTPTLSFSSFLQFFWFNPPSYAPIIHCGYGFSRTTAFLLIDIFNTMIERKVENDYSIESMFMMLRRSRYNLTPDPESMSLVYECVLYNILQRHTVLHGLKSFLEKHAKTIKPFEPIQQMRLIEMFVEPDKWFIDDKKRDIYIGKKQAERRLRLGYFKTTDGELNCKYHRFIPE